MIYDPKSNKVKELSKEEQMTDFEKLEIKFPSKLLEWIMPNGKKIQIPANIELWDKSKMSGNLAPWIMGDGEEVFIPKELASEIMKYLLKGLSEHGGPKKLKETRKVIDSLPPIIPPIIDESYFG